MDTAWKNQPGFDGTEPEYQQFFDKRVTRDDLASTLIENLSSYEAGCDEQIQSQEAKQKEKEALLREEAIRKETLLREEADPEGGSR